MELFPDKNVQEMKVIVDTLEMRSKEILEGKREALRAGDEALKQQIGEGKDIMSILRKQISGALIYDAYDSCGLYSEVEHVGRL